MHTSRTTQIIIWLLRVGLGWLFVYAGYTKLIAENWSPLGYIEHATTFPHIYEWLALPSNIEWVTTANIWGLLLIGGALVIGFRVRLAAIAGIILMLLYYFPILDFPLVGHGYIVDEHIIYILVLALLYAARAGEFWGVDSKVDVTIKT